MFMYLIGLVRWMLANDFRCDPEAGTLPDVIRCIIKILGLQGRDLVPLQGLLCINPV